MIKCRNLWILSEHLKNQGNHKNHKIYSSEKKLPRIIGSGAAFCV